MFHEFKKKDPIKDGKRPIFWDQEIHYATEPKKKWMLIFLTRQDCLIFYVQDKTETRLNSKIPGETKTNPSVSVSFFTRPRRESTFNEDIYSIFG